MIPGLEPTDVGKCGHSLSGRTEKVDPMNVDTFHDGDSVTYNLPCHDIKDYDGMILIRFSSSTEALCT